MDYRQNRYYLRYDGWLNSSSLLKVIKTCPSSAYVCKVLIALGTYKGNWCFSRFFVFWQILENSFFFPIFFLNFVCTRSTKEFLRTSLNVSVRFKSNWNLEVLVNMKRGKPEYPKKKTLGTKERTNNKLNPHMVSTQDSYPGHIGGRQVLSPLRHQVTKFQHVKLRS